MVEWGVFRGLPPQITRLGGRTGGIQVVLDPDYKLPDPGAAQQPSTAGPQGDPELATTRFHMYMAARAAVLGKSEELPPPVSSAQLDEAEKRLGGPLPADLRALYLIADGDQGRGLLNNTAWLPLELLVESNFDLCEQDPPPWDSAWDSVILDGDPPDTVRRCRAHESWLPFCSNEDGNYLAVDMAPARNGRPGQVIAIGRDYYYGGPIHLTDSITTLLGRYLELLEYGFYEVDDDNLDLDDPGSPSRPDRTAYGDIPEPIPPTLQAVHIDNVPSPVDLTPLTLAERLRQISLSRCSTDDLTPIAELPVESLSVTLDSADLTPLHGHPHLTSLDLRTTRPIDITTLTTVANLRCLDLSRADIQDPTILGKLTGLRYLAITGRQWRALTDANAVPPSLAAARLADSDVTDNDAVDWARSLGLGATRTPRFPGDYTTDDH
ncbi:SMI1/KNR4 family protein [Nocardia alni]|uniref:SMI1/KNR4 family protein n=1 Tax=Nocardia alni TaxID=2815723 RepID=UPI001C240276|nr:SMI1/KNR4 family protein [Nocardia alni]